MRRLDPTPETWSHPVLDILYVAGALALLALVGVIGRAVEKL
ncbi:hypothetical protein [Homoserinibacter sp. YIM 151385]|nr:hypothetical protein [Homoserinibacter sp. YIM 151385]WBU37135.1 hypothetical protein OF852_09390 [Homoserinibacter sp. YIM 151385]